MPKHDQPDQISDAERQTRIDRVTELAEQCGFVGEVEYRHVYSQSGGAQYCIGPDADHDIMVVYAEAFERDADPDDFNLDALIAHEGGHQRLHRDSKLQIVRAKFPGDAFEEILASIVGSILLGEAASAQTLQWKAAAELVDMGATAGYAQDFVAHLGDLVRRLS